MKTFRSLSLALLPLLASAAWAQDAPENGIPAPAPRPATPEAGGASRIAQIDAEGLAGLPALLRRGTGPAAISLRASQEEFEANKAAQDALLAYVNNGGVVFLHTGAARAFGYQTVPARLGTNALAGQLYGRARAALPFGAHPLLWDDGQIVPRRGPGADPTLFPGVNVVFYEMQEDDHLVISHPSGTALLEARELAGNAENTLFAAALAPFGRGLAVFTPDSIDQNRGDGALFARNLLRLIGSGSAPAIGNAVGNGNGAINEKLVAISAGIVQRGGTAPAALQRALLEAGAATSSPALPAFGTLPGAPAFQNPPGQLPMTPPMGTPEFQAAPQMQPPPPPGQGGPRPAVDQNGQVVDNGADNNGETADNGEGNEGAGNNEGAVNDEGADEEAVEANPGAAVLLLSSGEASAYASLIGAGDARSGAAINLLRARLFLSRGDVRGASRALEASAALAPNNLEIALWRGILQAGAAQNTNQPSPARAQLAEGAARDLAQAVGSPSILFGAANPGGGEGAARLNRGAGAGGARGASLTGLPVATLRAWSTKLGQIAQVFDLEPPSFQRYGAGSGAITVRGEANDASLLLILPAARALANARNFGWHGDNEEILVFPTAQTFLAYRRALGLSAPTVPLPAGAYGDVVGQRISMIALDSTTLTTRNPVTGLTTAARSGGGLDVLARLHSYVLLGAFDENAQSPLWLQLGLENLIHTAIVGNEQAVSNALILEQTAAQAGFLTLEQYGGGILSVRPDRLVVAQVQAASLMDFFYRSFGAGAVVETVQRVGLGQSIDDAMIATTEGDQLALFRSWRQTQRGLRGFPNQG